MKDAITTLFSLAFRCTRGKHTPAITWVIPDPDNSPRPNPAFGDVWVMPNPDANTQLRHYSSCWVCGKNLDKAKVAA